MSENKPPPARTPDGRYGEARKGALTGIAGNLALAALKIAVGTLGGSLALVTDGFHSLGDTGSSVAVLVGLRIASRPGDARHPYGHGKAESLVSNNIAVFLFLTALLLAGRAAGSLAAGEALAAPRPATLWTAVFSFAVKEGLYRYKSRLGGRLGSTSLVADAWHHRSDAMSSAAVIAGIGASLAGGPGWLFAEKAAALFVCAVIAFTAVSIYRKSSAELMDESGDRALLDAVRRKTAGVEGVKNIETLSARKSGLDFLVDIHIEVNPGLDVVSSHAIAKRVKEKLLDEILEVKSVLVHVEPFGPGGRSKE